jgi:hypothetical protein
MKPSLIFPMLIFSAKNVVSLNEQEQRENILDQIKKICEDQKEGIYAFAEQELIKSDPHLSLRTAKAEATEASMCYWIPKLDIAMDGNTVVVQTGLLEQLKEVWPNISNLFQFKKLPEDNQHMLMTVGKKFETVKLEGSFQDGFDAGKTLGKYEVPIPDRYLFSLKQGAALLKPNEFSVIPKEPLIEVIDNLPLDDKRKEELLGQLNAVDKIVVSKNESGNLTAISEDNFSKKLVNFINEITLDRYNRIISPAGSVYVSIPLAKPLGELLDLPNRGVRDAKVVETHLVKEDGQASR